MILVKMMESLFFHKKEFVRGTDSQIVDKALLLQGFAIVGTAFLI